jgi:hypothetical protein
MNVPANTANEKKKSWLAGGTCAALLLAFAVICWTAWLGKCAVFDEPLHFMGAWVQTHEGDFRCNPEDPPLWKFYVMAGTSRSDLAVRHDELWPMMLEQIPAPAVHFSREVLYQTPGNEADKLLRAARARMLALGVALGAGIAWWAWRLAGRLAAIVATAAFCFDPNFIAHSLLVKNDVAITLVFVTLLAFIWLVGQRGTIFRLAASVILVGVALTTKFSGVLAFPMLGIALVCRVIIPSPWTVLRWTFSTRRSRVVPALVLFLASTVFGYFSIWACYGFRFGPSHNPSEIFDLTSRRSAPLVSAAKNEMLLKQNPVPRGASDAQVQQWVNQWHPSLTVRMVRTCNKYHILPQAWLYGFLYTYASSLARWGFLCGDIRLNGWWYYFPLAMLFKTPLATLIGIVCAILVWIKVLRRPNQPRDWWFASTILAGPILYAIVAMRSHLNIGLRHIFPVYPFLFIFLGVMAAKAWQRWPRGTTRLVALIFVGLLAETFAAYPNYIPFFNVAVGGSHGGLALLSDSNIDWGQDLPAVAQWQTDHPDRQLWLSQFALPDPRYYGIHFIEMPGAMFYQPDQIAPSGLPSVYAISAVSLQGTYVTTDGQRQFYSHFLDQQPIGTLGGGAMYLYTAPNTLDAGPTLPVP